MFAILYALGLFVADLFKLRGQRQAENLFLRHQLNVALRQSLPRPRRSCDGIAQASRLTGAGNPEINKAVKD